MSKYCYSMVVDTPLDHPYKASLAVQSLMEFADARPETILVQFTTNVEPGFVEYFKLLGCKTRKIDPFLDGKYCNKIAQLGSIFDCLFPPRAGIFLLDIDLFVLGELHVPDPSTAWGKIVDAANPPLEVLTSLYSEAGISLPAEGNCDWSDAKTLETNFNGGFLYIPTSYVKRVHAAWTHWAHFLFSRKDMFGSPTQHAHIDQISFSMALAEQRIPRRHLSANFNFPCHSKAMPSTWEQTRPVTILHYHWCLDEFGLIDPVFEGNELFRSAVNCANGAIAGIDNAALFANYKRQRASIEAADKNLAAGCSAPPANGKRPGSRKSPCKLILHAGTPKTGTSSLQLTLGTKRDILSERGIWYPPPSETRMPKHQQLVGALMAGNPGTVAACIDHALHDMPAHIQTIFFTSEGIYNHWWDFPAENIAAFKAITKQFDFEIWVCLREPTAFISSLYAQYLKNPNFRGVSERVYGVDITFAEAMSDRWFRRHLDYLGFLFECHEIFGKESVRVFPYSDKVAEEMIIELLGFPLPEAPRQNASLSAAAIEIIRIINRYKLDPGRKEEAEKLVHELDSLLDGRSGKYSISPADKPLVRFHAEKTWRVVQELTAGPTGKQFRCGLP